jgi:hypothetical protein
MMMHKNKRTSKSKKGIFLGRYNSAIASGANPIGGAVVHPIERSRQKGEKLKPIIKNQLVDKWFRRNRLYFVSNEL